MTGLRIIALHHCTALRLNWAFKISPNSVVKLPDWTMVYLVFFPSFFSLWFLSLALYCIYLICVGYVHVFLTLFYLWVTSYSNRIYNLYSVELGMKQTWYPWAWSKTKWQKNFWIEWVALYTYYTLKKTDFIKALCGVECYENMYKMRQSYFVNLSSDFQILAWHKSNCNPLKWKQWIVDFVESSKPWRILKILTGCLWL